jgi:lambda family phage portal protein
MRTALVPRTKILDSAGQPWRPTAQQALQLSGDGPFKSASTYRRANALWHTSSGSADADLMPSLETLRFRSRDLKRNNPLAAGALNTMTTNVVGSGLLCNPVINYRALGLSRQQAKEKKKEIVDLWTEWGESVECDLNRVSDWYGLQRLAYGSMLESGDALALAPPVNRPGADLQTRVQIVEADRIANPTGHFDRERLVGGVEMDQYGAPQAYHVRTVHPGSSWSLSSSWQSLRIRAFGAATGRRNAWLLYQRQRPGQTRGIPYLSIVLEHAKQLDRYTDAELMAAIVGGSFTVFVKSPNGEGLMPLASMPLQTTAGTGAATPNDIALDYGAIVDLAPGEEIQTASPNRPNRAYGEFVKSVIEFFSAGLNLPFELLLKHFTASYSASRAALLEAWRFFKIERNWFAAHFCQPFYELVLTEAVLRERIDLPGYLENPRAKRAWGFALWTGPSMGQLNPLDEVEAAKERVKMGISSLANEASEITGEDWEDIHEQRVEETEKRRRDRLEPDPDEITEQAPSGMSFPINYRELGREIARAMKEAA